MSLSVIPRRHPEASMARVAGQWVVATVDGRSHGFEEANGNVSEVGERIIEWIDGQRTVGQIAQLVHGDFDVALEVAERDTLCFVAMLIEKHILTL